MFFNGSSSACTKKVNEFQNLECANSQISSSCGRFTSHYTIRNHFLVIHSLNVHWRMDAASRQSFFVQGKRREMRRSLWRASWARRSKSGFSPRRSCVGLLCCSVVLIRLGAHFSLVVLACSVRFFVIFSVFAKAPGVRPRQEKKCRRSEVVKVTERVLVTEWIDGVKLDASKESDVAAASASYMRDNQGTSKGPFSATLPKMFE